MPRRRRPPTPTSACTRSRTCSCARTRSTSTGIFAPPAHRRVDERRADASRRLHARLRPLLLRDGIQVQGLDKFPRLLDYVTPAGVADRRRVARAPGRLPLPRHHGHARGLRELQRRHARRQHGRGTHLAGRRRGRRQRHRRRGIHHGHPLGRRRAPRLDRRARAARRERRRRHLARRRLASSRPASTSPPARRSCSPRARATSDGTPQSVKARGALRARPASCSAAIR